MILNSPYISGSLTVTGNTNLMGALTVTGSLAGTATSSSFAFTASSAVSAYTAASAVNATTALTASYATSFTVGGTLTAQTLVVQTITSSVSFITGSTRFGSLLTNTHDFTGSVRITGSGPHTIFGNVGIGTTTPNNLTDIVGSTAGDGGAFNGTGAILRVRQNATWTGNQPWALYVEGYSYLNGFRINAADGIRALLKTAAGGQLGFATTGNDPITFTQLDATERMRIAAGGNVGIGIANPSAVLHISGSGSGSLMQISSHVSSSIFFVSGSGNVGIGTSSPTSLLDITSTGTVIHTIKSTSTSGARDAQLRLSVANTGTNDSAGRILFTYSTNFTEAARIEAVSDSGGNWADLRFGTGASGTERMRITSGGNVGIGTTSPGALLHIFGAGSGNSATYIKYTCGDGGDIRVGKADGVNNNAIFGTWSNNDVLLYANSTERMRILSGGNVGIGTTNPNARLDLGSSYGASGEKFLIYNDDTSGALAGTKMGFYIDRFSESNSLSLIFPYAPATTSRFHVAYKNTSNTTLVDVCYVTYNSTAWTFPSDERMKNVEGVIPNALNKIKDLRAVYYTQKRDPEQKRKVGLLAQDLLKVLPEVVDVPDTELDSNGNQRYMSVALADTIPLLVKAIQELKAELDELKNK